MALCVETCTSRTILANSTLQTNIHIEKSKWWKQTIEKSKWWKKFAWKCALHDFWLLILEKLLFYDDSWMRTVTCARAVLSRITRIRLKLHKIQPLILQSTNKNCKATKREHIQKKLKTTLFVENSLWCWYFNVDYTVAFNSSTSHKMTIWHLSLLDLAASSVTGLKNKQWSSPAATGRHWWA